MPSAPTFAVSGGLLPSTISCLTWAGVKSEYGWLKVINSYRNIPNEKESALKEKKKKSKRDYELLIPKFGNQRGFLGAVYMSGEPAR